MRSWALERHPLLDDDIREQFDYFLEDALFPLEVIDAFSRDLEVALRTIARSPLAYAVLYRYVRHLVLKTFRNHVLHYVVREDAGQVVIIGLFHGAEDPETWERRLDAVEGAKGEVTGKG